MRFPVYTVSRPRANLLFCIRKMWLTTLFFLWVKSGDCLRKLVSREKYSKRYLSTLTTRHIAIVTPYVYAHALSHEIKFAGNKIVRLLSQPPSAKLSFRQYYPLYGSKYPWVLQFSFRRHLYYLSISVKNILKHWN